MTVRKEERLEIKRLRRMAAQELQGIEAFAATRRALARATAATAALAGTNPATPPPALVAQPAA
jgi:hypothetical protein